MEKQEAWKVSALEEVSAGLPDIFGTEGSAKELAERAEAGDEKL